MILIHTGPYAEQQMRDISRGFDKDQEVRLASLYPSSDDAGLVDLFAKAIKAYSKNKKFQLSQSDLESILRCRTLRSISQDKASILLNAIRSAWRVILDEINPKIVISEMIDSYIIDVLFQECESRQIEFIGLVTCFVNGYFRTTNYGEYTKLRTPQDDEVKRVTTELLKKSYKPQFIIKNEKNITKKAFIRWATNLARALWLGILSISPKNRRINMIYGAFLTSLGQLHFFPNLSLGDDKWEEKIKNSTKPIIYIPLQHVPEATIDYWCADVNKIDYDNELIKLVERYGSDFNFVFKEHPNTLGLRNPRIYKKLQSYPSVFFAKTSASSIKIIDMCQAVLVWTGSVGFEAALRGKAVLSMSPVYYMSKGRFLLLNDKSTSPEIISFIKAQSTHAISGKEQFNMVKYLLSGLIPGKIAFMNNFKLKRKSYTHSLDIGSELKKAFYNKLNNKNN